ncbi:MAG: hypothetical protein ACLGG9_11315 [Thermoleophilia bacterium]
MADRDTHTPDWLPDARRGARPALRHARAVGIAVLVAVLVAAIVNVFGQRRAISTSRAPAADLTVSAPERIRTGLIDELRITIRPHREIEAPRIVLSPEWNHQVTFNTVSPEPAAHGYTDGPVLAYGPLDAGGILEIAIQFQVNPTAVGRRDWSVRLQDGERTVAVVERSAVIFP